MRKQTKLVAVLSAAALLAIGASMTSMAAQGWQQEGDDWYYYDNNGDYVTDEWKKSGNNWYYLGDDGYMMKNYLLEDGDNVFYLDGNGVMVTNAWVAVAPDEDDYEDDAPEHYWYYFQSTGRAIKASGTNAIKKKDINGKTYGFDEDGRMLYGFVDDSGDRLTDEDPFEDALYYFGDSDDGAMTKGWLQYMDGSSLKEDYEDLNEMWFYFNPSTGKKVTGEGEANNVKTKNVNGKKYAFDENGVMISSWDDVSTSSSNQKYYNAETDGHLAKKTWIWAVPSAEIDESDNDEDNYRWFYAGSNGETYKSEKKKINGKWYVFDPVGRMKAGLVIIDDDNTYNDVVSTDDTTGDMLIAGNYASDDSDHGKADGTIDSTEGLYYFGDEATDGSMKTGKSIKIELQDDVYTFGFAKDGKGYNKLESNKIYMNGVLIQADSDYKYQTVFNVAAQGDIDTGDKDDDKQAILAETEAKTGIVEEDASSTDFVSGAKYANYVVGTSGTVIKPGKYVKDADDNYYAVNKSGDIAFFPSSDEAKDGAQAWAKQE
ncbi:MAG: N-acetylmuramoyl-L-alanine amidase family protein [Candidatus Avilachnospira sp.]